MASDLLSQILSSTNSLKIASLVSIRPRTQGELAELTGVSTPGVLKHLRRLMKLGLVKREKLEARQFKARWVYTTRGAVVGDFSAVDLRVARLLEKGGLTSPSGLPRGSMEALAEDIILQRRRIRDQVRKLVRMIDDLLEDQARLSATADAVGAGESERLILKTIFTEEDSREGEQALIRHSGLKGGRRSIDRVMAEARGIAKS